MNKFFGLCILVILLVAASGCTQPAATPATPAPTVVVTTEVPTPEATMPPATIEKTVVPTVAVKENVTAEPTEVATTKATPRVPATPSTKITTIYIRNGTFVPSELTVLPGTGITWVNEDKVIHQIKTLPSAPFKFTSSELVYGASFGYTYGDTEGEYGYYDTVTNSTGLIIVKKGESFVGMPTTTQTVAPTATN